MKISVVKLYVFIFFYLYKYIVASPKATRAPRRAKYEEYQVLHNEFWNQTGNLVHFSVAPMYIVVE